METRILCEYLIHVPLKTDVMIVICFVHRIFTSYYPRYSALSPHFTCKFHQLDVYENRKKKCMNCRDILLHISIATLCTHIPKCEHYITLSNYIICICLYCVYVSAVNVFHEHTLKHLPILHICWHACRQECMLGYEGPSLKRLRYHVDQNVIFITRIILHFRHVIFTPSPPGE